MQGLDFKNKKLIKYLVIIFIVFFVLIFLCFFYKKNSILKQDLKLPKVIQNLPCEIGVREVYDNKVCFMTNIEKDCSTKRITGQTKIDKKGQKSCMIKH